MSVKEYRIGVDIFLYESYAVEASSKKEAVEKAKDEAYGQYPGAEVTVFEVEVVA